MTRISDVEDENRYRNDLGRENRGAIKRSIVIALLAVGAIAAAVLLAPARHPTPIGLDANGSTVAFAGPESWPEPTGPGYESFVPHHIMLPGEKIEISYR
jgi:hypothetical protein